MDGGRGPSRLAPEPQGHCGPLPTRPAPGQLQALPGLRHHTTPDLIHPVWPQELNDLPPGKPDEGGSRFTSRPDATVEDFRQPVIERFEVSSLPLMMAS